MSLNAAEIMIDGKAYVSVKAENIGSCDGCVFVEEIICPPYTDCDNIVWKEKECKR